MPVVRDGDTAKDSKVWLQAIQHIFSDKYCWLLKVIIKIVMNINTSCCVWSSSCRFVLWRRHFFSRAATVVHMSLLWQDGLHRDILTGACHLRAFRDFHGGGEYTHCTNGTAQYTFVYYYKLRNVLISLSILVYLCYPLACSEFSHHCNSQLLHFSGILWAFSTAEQSKTKAQAAHTADTWLPSRLSDQQLLESGGEKMPLKRVTRANLLFNLVFVFFMTLTARWNGN